MADRDQHEFELSVRPDPPDVRDRAYTEPAAAEEQFYQPSDEQFIAGILSHPISIPPELWVDRYRELAEPAWHQRGQECTGFALAAIATFHIRRRIPEERWAEITDAERRDHVASRRMLYEMAQRFDGEDFEEGSTLRGALKGWKKLGVASEAVWPYAPGDEHGEKHGTLNLPRVVDAVSRPGGYYFRIDRDDHVNMRDALARGYPLYASARLHDGWYRRFLPDVDGVVERRDGDKLLGGHAFVIVGYNSVGWRVHNSWGRHWGDDGFGVLPFDDWAVNGQDVWFAIPPQPVTRRNPTDIGPDPVSDAEAERTLDVMWRHVVTIGDDGRLSSSGRYRLDVGTLKTLLLMFQKRTETWSKRRLAIFADGGYWATPETIEQLRPLCEQLLEAEIYPLFLVWETPWFADLQGWLYGQPGFDPEHAPRTVNDWRELGGLPMAKMLTAESVAPRVWSEIERRAELVCAPDGAGPALASAIGYKRGQVQFDLHLIGHGAGDLLLSRLAPLMPTRAATCNLWAPATTIAHFESSYGEMLDCGCLRHLSIHVLDDHTERNDSLGPIPGSLLFAVADVLAVDDLDLSTAIEVRDDGMVWTSDPEPVLGLQGHVSTDPGLRARRDSGVLEVRVAAGGQAVDPPQSHTAMITDPGVLQATIADILAHGSESTGWDPPDPHRDPPRPRPGRGDPLSQAGGTDPLRG